MTQPTRQARLPLPITPRGGAVGTVVTLGATGLPPESTLLIAFANLQGYQLLQRVVTDGEGSFSTEETVPDWAELDGVHYFFASFADEIPLAFSGGFHVTAKDGTARVRGTLESRGEGCVDLRTRPDVVYHLVGAVGAYEPGERAVVTSTIAEEAVCEGPGVAIAVSEVTFPSR